MSKVEKIIVLGLLTAGFKKMYTPPYSPPPKGELVRSIGIDIHFIRRKRLVLVRTGQTLLALAEIATMIAQIYPTQRLSRLILSKILLPNQQTGNLGFTGLQFLAAVIWSFGTILRLRAIGTLGKFFHYDVSIQRDHELVTSGAYAWVRHPSYSGILVSTIGWCLWHAAPNSWLRQSKLLHTTIGRAFLALYILGGMIPINMITLGRMKVEDDVLRKEFGEKWEVWRKNVPYYVIPWVY